MPDVKLTLSVVDQSKAALVELRKNFEGIAALSRQQFGSSSDTAKQMQQGAAQTAQLAKHFGEAATQAKVVQTSTQSATRAISGLQQGVASFASGVGFGPLAGLIGAASIGSLLVAIGGTMAQAVRLAHEFEGVAAQAALQLTIGGGSLTAAVNQIKAGSRQISARYQFSEQDSARFISSYAAASGATAKASVAGGEISALYGRALGLDPNRLATQLGTLSQYTPPGSTERNPALVFGAAAQAGRLGRRLDQFVDVATRTLEKLQMGVPGQSIDLRDALREVVGISKAGGIFATAPGNALTAGALQNLGMGGADNPFLASVMRRAGFSYGQIVAGVNAPKDSIRIGQELERELGKATPGYGNIQLLRMLQIRAGSDQGGDALYNLALKKGGFGNILESDISPLTKEDAAKKAKEFLDTPEGKMITALNTLNTTLTEMGERAFPDLAGQFLRLTDWLANNIPSIQAAVTNLIKAIGPLQGALIAAAVVFGGKIISGLGRGVLRGLLPGGPGGLPAEILGFLSQFIMSGSSPDDYGPNSGNQRVALGSTLTRDESHWLADLDAFNTLRSHGAGFMRAETPQSAATLIGAGKEFNVDPALLYGIHGAESSFGKFNQRDPFAQMGLISGPGAYNAYGYKGTGQNTFAEAARTTAAMIASLRRDYNKSHPKGQTLLGYIRDHFAPLGAGNDPTNLNANWLKNVGGYDHEVGGQVAGQAYYGSDETPTTSAIPKRGTGKPKTQHVATPAFNVEVIVTPTTMGIGADQIVLPPPRTKAATGTRR